ncbi:MAG: phosphoribosylformylglycinamidine synthase subunit PurQ [Thermoplasmata archaeon]
MKRENIKIAVVRIEGTNCEEESYLAFKRLGADAEKVHLKQFTGDDVSADEKRALEDYDILMIPGGFSSGDYIRAGVIFAARFKSALKEDITAFAESGRPILGVCNGFQVLVEMGLLPSVEGEVTDVPQAVLATNDSSKFECRPSLLIVQNNSKCVFTRSYERGETVVFPSAHAEGKFMVKDDDTFKKLKENGQVVFRYTSPEGKSVDYPWNPNGSIDNIAGICNPQGNVLGLMPHPERVFDGYTNPSWTRGQNKGDGRLLFKSVLDYVEEEF